MNKLTHLSLYAILFAAILFLYYKDYSKSKLVVVQSQLVVESYDGMAEARKLYEKDIQELNLKFEGQKNLFEVKKRVYDSLETKYSTEERKTQLYDLERIRQNTYKLGEALQEKAEEKETVLIEGVFNKINDYIERYGEENNVDVIIGTTLSGNVLYANNAIDVTEEIVAGMNEEYTKGL